MVVGINTHEVLENADSQLGGHFANKGNIDVDIQHLLSFVSSTCGSNWLRLILAALGHDLQQQCKHRPADHLLSSRYFTPPGTTCAYCGRSCGSCIGEKVILQRIYHSDEGRVTSSRIQKQCTPHWKKNEYKYRQAREVSDSDWESRSVIIRNYLKHPHCISSFPTRSDRTHCQPSFRSIVTQICRDCSFWCASCIINQMSL